MPSNRPSVLDWKARLIPSRAIAQSLPAGPLKILDLCCGSGRASIHIAASNPESEVTGIDLSPAALKGAEYKIRRRGLSNMSVRTMSADSLSFADGEFDAAVVSMGLHEMEPQAMRRALAEIRRVLNGEGTLLIFDYTRPNLLERIPLRAFIKMVEPDHVKDFVRIDWKELLGGLGFVLQYTRRYPFTRLIAAYKSPRE